MTDEIRRPSTVVIDGVQYRRGDKVPMPPKRKLKVYKQKQQFIEIKKRV